MAIIITSIFTLALSLLGIILTLKQVPYESPSETFDAGYVDFLTVNVLIDNNPNPHLSLAAPWGVSMFIETENLTVLFDAGPDPQALKENSEKLGVDLSTLDFAVISHEHGDHVRGLSYAAELNRNLTVYVPKHMSNQRKAWIKALGCNVVEIESTTVISGGIAIIGELYGPPYEQALAINVKDFGLIIFVGCSHPGVENFVAKAKEELDSKPYAVIGGFHLSGASLDKIKSTAKKLVEMELKKVYSIHCTGEEFRSYVKENFPGIYGNGRVGLKLTFNSNCERNST